MDQMVRLLGLTRPPPEPASAPPLAAAQHRELADAMRCLPGGFQDRLPASTLRRVADSAALGRWEKAIGELIMGLYMRDAPVSATERGELRDALQALGVPAHRLDRLRSR
ncbi:hypothetical protein AB0C84_06390 [Actinomadura sp. NPDC048955]|uniref:hypothetical protein n=1 Tax=Actinomadura sp. NPDC048955 TaxID=3158228 RepID=UPI0033D40EDD